MPNFKSRFFNYVFHDPFSPEVNPGIMVGNLVGKTKGSLYTAIGSHNLLRSHQKRAPPWWSADGTQHVPPELWASVK